MASRLPRAVSRHVGDGALNDLGGLDRLRHELDGHILDAVAPLWDQPFCYSWAQIGRALGVSPQAAAQRFAKAGGARRPGGQPGNLR